MQLHQTSHSSIMQHFWRVKVGRADLADVRLSGLNDWYLQFATVARVSEGATTGCCGCKRESRTKEEAVVQASNF
jgi:hypothetical protein